MLLEVADGLADTTVKGRIGIDQVTEVVRRDLVANGELEDPEKIAAARSHRRGADQDASVRVLDHLDEAIVARSMDPTTRGHGHLLTGGADVDPLLACLLLGQT